MKGLSGIVWRLAALLLYGAGWSGCAQVIQISGGASTLDQSRGGTVTLKDGSVAGSVGAGTIGGAFFGGASVTKTFEKSTLTLGSAEIPFDLPTDLFEQGHFLAVLGAGWGVQRATGQTYVFAGSTATGFNSPYFNAAQVDHAALVLWDWDQLDEHWKATTTVLLSNTLTLLQSFDYKSTDGRTKFGITSGFGSNDPYGAVSVSLHRQRWDLDAEYVETTGGFRRENVKEPLNSEPNKENVLLALRPSDTLNFSFSRQNYLSPVYGSDLNTASTVNQATVGDRLAGMDVGATVSESIYAGRTNVAEFLTASRGVGEKTHVQLAYLVSRADGLPATEVWIGTVGETLSPRWTVSETMNASGGQETAGFGGSFLSNMATVTAEYQTFYVPALVNAPFERALIVSADVHVAGRVTVHGGSFVAPDGRVLYDTGARGEVARGEARAAPLGEHSRIGTMVLRGRVFDRMGRPVMGAAVRLDEVVVYTDSRGYFVVREKKVHGHRLAVLGDRFLDGAEYRVVSSPGWVFSSRDPNREEVILVERVPRTAAAGKGTKP